MFEVNMIWYAISNETDTKINASMSKENIMENIRNVTLTSIERVGIYNPHRLVAGSSWSKILLL